MEDAGENDKLDEISIEETFIGTGDDCEITLTYNSTRFIILLKRPSSVEEDTIEGKLLRELDDAAAMSDEMIYDRYLENIHDIVVSECKMTMHKLAPVRHSNLCVQTLEDRLYPKTFVLQLITIGGKLEILEHYSSDSLKYPHSPIELDPVLVLSTDTPMVPAAAIRIVKNLHFQKVVEVEWAYDTYAFKTAFSGGEAELRREIRILQVLETELGHRYPRVPRLRGFVVSHGKIVGFLEELIPGCCMLGQMDILSVPRDHRVRWAFKIEETLQALHRIGLSWGDAKADNVLIDREGEPWVVDFGGSFTEGWVKSDAKETRDGDLQGLQGIVEFLKI